MHKYRKKNFFNSILNVAQTLGTDFGYNSYLRKVAVGGIMQVGGEHMGKTSAAVKNRYNDKAYDRINLIVKKGQKDILKAHAAARGESLNGFIARAIKEAVERDGAEPGSTD